MYQLTLYLKNKKDKSITAKILEGSLFESLDKKYQDLRCIETNKFTIPPKELKVIKVQAGCINPANTPPSKNNYRLTMMIGKKKEVLEALGILTTTSSEAETVSNAVKHSKSISKQDIETKLKHLENLHATLLEKKNVLEEGLAVFAKGTEPVDRTIALRDTIKTIKETENKIKNLKKQLNLKLP